MKIGDIYKCNVCGNVVVMTEVGGGELVCCDESMELLVPKPKANEGKEKHVPVIEKTVNGTKVTVGSILHPMEAKHYIRLIQLYDNDKLVAQKYLYVGDKPEFVFNAKGNKAMAYCNIHGLWSSN